MSLIKSATANTHWIYIICDTSWTRSKVWVIFHHGMKNCIDRVCGQIVRTLLALTKCLRQRLKHNMLNRCCQHDVVCNKLCKDSIWENTCKQAIDIFCVRSWNKSLAHNTRRSFLQNLKLVIDAAHDTIWATVVDKGCGELFYVLIARRACATKVRKQIMRDRTRIALDTHCLDWVFTTTLENQQDRVYDTIWWRTTYNNTWHWHNLGLEW